MSSHVDWPGVTKLRTFFHDHPTAHPKKFLMKLFDYQRSETKLNSLMCAAQNIGILFSEGDNGSIRLVKDIPNTDYEILIRGGSELTEGLISNPHTKVSKEKIQARTKKTIIRMHEITRNTNGITRAELRSVLKISNDRIRDLLELGNLVNMPFYAHNGLIMNDKQYQKFSVSGRSHKPPRRNRISGAPLIRVVETNGIGGSDMIKNVDPYAWARN